MKPAAERLPAKRSTGQTIFYSYGFLLSMLGRNEKNETAIEKSPHSATLYDSGKFMPLQPNRWQKQRSNTGSQNTEIEE
jgi:hypothetical protein